MSGGASRQGGPTTHISTSAKALMTDTQALTSVALSH